MSERPHLPVMLVEVMAAVAPLREAVIVDATFGAGGYATAFLEAGARVVALDRDPNAARFAEPLRTAYGERFRLIRRPFSELEAALEEAQAPHCDALAFDLGVSSMQIDEAARGFSFMRDGPLDMRMSQDGASAADLVNAAPPEELTRIFRRYGEEPAAKRIAAALVRRREDRPFERTGDLADTVEAVLGGRRGAPTHPATRVFQALRIAVNDELGELEAGLLAAERVLAPEGRLAVVTFHSLEDRIVKAFLTERAGRTPAASRHQPPRAAGPAPTFELTFNGARAAGPAETAINPRARSAKLRAARLHGGLALEDGGMIGFLFRKRIRGFRVAELAAFGCLSVLVLGVYFSKAHAGGETARIDDVEQQIGDEQHRVRLLQAELAHLEAPERLQRLSQQYLALAPIDAKRETAPDALMEIARQAAAPPPTTPAAKPVALLKVSAPRPAGISHVRWSAPVTVDTHDYREPYGPAQVWRWLSERMWAVERAFEQAKTSGRAVDDTRLRIFFILAIFALAFVTLGLRATRAALFAPVEATDGVAPTVAGSRADLVDREGRLLAVDLPHYGLYLDPREIWDAGETRRRLPAAFPKLSPERLEKALRANRREYLVGGLTPQEMADIRDLGLPGVSFEDEVRRVYPVGRTAAHLIGFTDAGGRGLSGAEKALDTPIRDGGSGPTALAVDLRVQAALQDELQKAQDKFGTINAMGMVVNMHTGEILAMSSLPDFDPNAPGKSPIPDLTNHEAASVYELGSVFKAFTVAMGLDTGTVTLDTPFDVHAPLMMGGHLIHDFDKGDGTLALWQVFTHSSNIGAAKLALEAGPERLTDYFRRFGLFKAAPSEMFESARPILPHRFDEDSLAHMAFGQAISVSPLALATGYTALMNGGVYRPLTIRKVEPGHQAKGMRVISEQTSYTMLQLMRMNVHTDPKGSGHKADVLGLRVGGKTGSAQKPEHGHYSKNNISSFVAVFPTDGPIDADRYLVIVTLDSPHVTPDSYGFITAGWNAAPTAGAVINRIAPFLGVQRIITADQPLPGQPVGAPASDAAE